MKKSAHIKLGSVCYRLKDAKILANQWSQVIKDPMWAMATELVLTVLMRKLQKERGRKWDMPDLRLLAQSSRDDLLKILSAYRPKYGRLLEGELKVAEALMINLQIALSGLVA